MCGLKITKTLLILSAVLLVVPNQFGLKRNKISFLPSMSTGWDLCYQRDICEILSWTVFRVLEIFTTNTKKNPDQPKSKEAKYKRNYNQSVLFCSPVTSSCDISDRSFIGFLKPSLGSTSLFLFLWLVTSFCLVWFGVSFSPQNAVVTQTCNFFGILFVETVWTSPLSHFNVLSQLYVLQIQFFCFCLF